MTFINRKNLYLIHPRPGTEATFGFEFFARDLLKIIKAFRAVGWNFDNKPTFKVFAEGCFSILIPVPLTGLKIFVPGIEQCLKKQEDGQNSCSKS